MPTLQDLYAFLNQPPSGQRIGQALANASRPAVPVPSGDDPRLEQARSLSAGLAQGLLGMGGSRPSVMDDFSGSYDLGEGAGLLGNALPLAKALAAPMATMGLLSAVAKARGVTTTPSRLAQALKSQEGMIAYHGSPHTFDKFSLDKIGTGEGAQAYGNGLYLAEHPNVADAYKTAGDDSTRLFINGNENTLSPAASSWLVQNQLDPTKAFKEAKASGVPSDVLGELQSVSGASIKWGADKNVGNLYKTDIPDEAVSRFLDWDKPLSQQPNVMEILRNSERFGPNSENWAGAPAGQWESNLGARKGADLYIRGPWADDANKATESLKALGIPGVRYLDGGSRGAGSGTSNFVVFDPEMIRILERNGQATGAQPWQPGEWQGLLSK